jgi:MarR family transcriptional regulator for hemolysin
MAGDRAGEKDQDGLPDDLRFVQLLWQLDHALNKRSRRLLRVLGVTAPQRFIIRVIALKPGATPSQIARYLHVTPATVTRVVQRMEEAGFLRREADPADSRRVLLHLTAKARRIEERAGSAGESPVTRVLERTPAARIEETTRMLSALIEELERT